MIQGLPAKQAALAYTDPERGNWQMKDYYRILGVERQASDEQIKKHTGNLQKKYHPDVVKDDQAKRERMYEIQEAYECLGNEQRRRKYDTDCASMSKTGAGAGSERDMRKGPCAVRTRNAGFKPV